MYRSHFWVAAVVAMALTVSFAAAANVDFIGPVGGDWNTNANWNPAPVPGPAPGAGDNVFVMAYGGATKVISLSGTPTPNTINELCLAREGNGTVTVNQTGGELIVNSWLNLGQGFGGAPNNGTGVYNLSGDAILRSTHSAGGQTVIGAGFTAAPGRNVGRLTITDNAQFIQTANEFRMGGEHAGTPNADGYVTVSGNGVLSVSNNLQIGTYGTGTMDITGGSVTCGTWPAIGRYAGGTGTLNISAGSFNQTGAGNALIVAELGHGVVNLSSTGVINARQLWLGLGNGSTGEVFQTGGTMSVTGELRMARAASAGHYTLSDGTLTVGSSMFVGDVGTASLNVTGGTINVTSGLMVWNGTGTINVGQDAGKTTQVTTSWITLGQDTGTGVLNQTGGSVNLTNSHLYLGYGAAATGTYNLSNGTLTINGDIRTDSGTGLFNQTGGSTTANWIRMGINAGSDGEFRVSNSPVQINNIVRIGENGTGILRISGTGQLTANGDLMIGFGASGQGSAFLSDSGVLTVNGGVMRVGDAGTGNMTMTGGTINTANWFVIGQGGNKTSTFNMSGGVLNVNTNGGGERLQISVWDTAQGVMNVSGNAQVNVNASSIQVGGDHAGAGGTLTLADTAVINTPQLTVGWRGNGTVTQDGGTMNITGSHVRFGDNSSPTGTYNMNGGLLQVVGDIRNDVGTAVFNQTGGTVNANYLRMALGGGTTASYTATGGTTTIPQETDFGARGTGTLTVGSTSPVSFATVTLNDLWLGRSRWGGGESGGTGNVRVYGDGRLIVNRLIAGGSATSTINVEGGLLESRGGGDDTLLGTETATGILNVSGGRVNVPTGNLQIGLTGVGQLNASGTGQVDVGTWFVAGRYAGGIGTINARDNAVLNANGAANAMILGELGTGTLNVYDSARVNVANQLRVGFVNTGTANLYGGTVRSPDTVIAMNAGSTGTLNLAGGTLDTTNLYFGAGAGSFNWTSGTLKPGTVRMNVSNPGGRLEVSQQGWTVGWYDGNAMTDAAADSWNPFTVPLYVETVNAVNWGGAYPAVFGGDQDYNGAVYQARLYVPQAGNYSFRERVDDSSALYIDGVKRLWDYTNGSDFGEPAGDPWTVHSSTTVSLGQGWHLLDFRYSDHWGGQNAYLEWDPAGGTNWQILGLAGLGTDIGISVIAGDYAQGPGGELALDIMGLPFGYDQLLVAGEANLAGVLTAMPGPDVHLGDRFTVLLASELNGRFGEVAGTGFSYADGYWRALYDYQAGTVTLEATAPEPVTLGLLSLAGATLGAYVRRRRRR